jgi:hypothetical protein
LQGIFDFCFSREKERKQKVIERIFFFSLFLSKNKNQNCISEKEIIFKNNKNTFIKK